MPPDQRDCAYLFDMVEAAQKVEGYVRGKTFEDYERDDLLRDGVERNIEIIGEAARRVSETFKQNHPEIPWRKIIAQRNVLAHEYDYVGNREIWDTVTLQIPTLIAKLKPLIPPLPPDADG